MARLPKLPIEIIINHIIPQIDDAKGLNSALRCLRRGTVDPSIISLLKDKHAQEVIKMSSSNIWRDIDDFAMGKYKHIYHILPNGWLYGLYTIYKRDTLSSQVIFIDDKEHGIETYYNKGMPSQSITWNMGVEHGEMITYQDGYLYERTYYWRGNECGPSILYHDESDDLLSISELLNGRKYGITEQYSPLGILTSMETYKNDELHGPSIKYYTCGRIRERAFYINGEKMWFKRYYVSGALLYGSHDKRYRRIQLGPKLLKGSVELYSSE